MKKTGLSLVLLFIFALLNAQTDQPPIKVRKIDSPIKIDGELDEAVWLESQASPSFHQYFPTDSAEVKQDTEIYMAFDKKNLYVAVKCYAAGNEYVVPTLRRDFRAGGSDNITLLFDPFNTRTNAFVFGMNPLGVRREAIISGGGRSRGDWAGSWDNKWRGESKIHDKYWTAEFAIPFKTLRYNEGVTTWRFNSYRFDTQSNEISSWMHIPRNQIVMNLAFMGEMQWEEAPPKPGSNISLIPYAITDMTRDFEANEDANYAWNVGGDAKVAVTSGLNLDLTVNPDFSQVEVDRQVTNLTRFEIRLPEQRQFFLENADIFGGFGSGSANPFFSRRIGISYDTVSEQNIQNQIYAGARLSGNLNNDWRIGLLNMQAAADEINGLPSYNYTVAAVRRNLFERSNIGAIFVNKETFEDVPEGSEFSPYNRVVGLDYNLANTDNSWVGRAYYHRSITPEKLDGQYSYAANLRHTKRDYELGVDYRDVGENFDAEVGFVPRTGIQRVRAEAQWNYYPEDTRLFVQHGPNIETTFFFTPEDGKTDHRLEANWEFEFSSFARSRVGLVHQYTRLFEEFNPTRVDTTENNVKLLQPGIYRYASFRGNYNSDRRKPFSWDVRPNVGQFFNGWRYGLAGGFALNLQPRARIELNYNFNYIDLPDGFDSAAIWLVGPRIDLTFSKNLFLTTFFQYNNQIDNFNINARLQWRFAPVSDFFLVYTDNYSTDFLTKNRAIVAKVTYWLNV